MPEVAPTSLPRIAVLGTGRMGSVLALALKEGRWPVDGVWNRHPERARALGDRLGPPSRVYENAEAAFASAEVVFLTVADDAVSALAEHLAPAVRAGQVVFHTSGVLTAGELDPLARAGAHVGALHALQTFADVDRGLERVHGVYWTVDGDDEARAIAGRVVRVLRGRLLRVPPEGRVLYHAAAVVASNYLVALADQASHLMVAAGVAREDALAALIPLMQGTLANLEASDASSALTGPVARGDSATVRRHLEALQLDLPDAVLLYRMLGTRCLALARTRGLPPELEAALKKVLSEPDPGPIPYSDRARGSEK